ncbi:neuropeptides capa receptor-like, partial [Lycorma delicatula]|uniref:neuropeptides capa receptor-like n=1 Tax=Lycorma delicatula TaxID=130591 RepID=UPI003F519CAC
IVLPVSNILESINLQCLPYDLTVFWQQYPWTFSVGICKLRALVSEMASNTSVLTIVAFSAERYLAICHPLHAYVLSSLRRAVKVIAGLWLLSFIAALPFAAFSRVNYIDYPNSQCPVLESAFCAMLKKNIPPNWPIYEISSLGFFFLPLVFLIIGYARMGHAIRTRHRRTLGDRLSGTVHGEARNLHARKSTIRMLTAVVTTFFLCWAPFHLQRLLYIHGEHLSSYREINEWLYYIAGLSCYISTTVNAILYNLMSVKYRHAFRKTLCGASEKRSFRDAESSFREVDSPRWNRRVTWRRRKPSTDLVVVIDSRSPWPSTLLKLSMENKTNSTPAQPDVETQQPTKESG